MLSIYCMSRCGKPKPCFFKTWLGFFQFYHAKSYDLESTSQDLFINLTKPGTWHTTIPGPNIGRLLGPNWDRQPGPNWGKLLGPNHGKYCGKLLAHNLGTVLGPNHGKLMWSSFLSCIAGKDYWYHMKVNSHLNCVFPHPEPPLPRLSPKIVGVRESVQNKWFPYKNMVKTKTKNNMHEKIN